jgi:hypothetical protein
MAALVMTRTTECECTTSRKDLIPIPVGGPLTKYQICPKCGTVWVERYRTPEGRPESRMDFDIDDDLVPSAVRAKGYALVGPMPRHPQRS